MQKLKSLSNPENLAGMARYGINTVNTYGVSINILRPMAKELGKDHLLAQQLWSSGIHEARILASMVDAPSKVTEEQMESWVRDFDSWDVCDQVCSNLFDKTKFAYRKVHEWSRREEEFVKRAAFALMAALAVHDKRATDEVFKHFLPLITGQATDGRNFVRKAANWALRSIGKRNMALNTVAVAAARELLETDSKAARWVASDALRELTSDKVQKKLRG
jgi:3-methyladenine DNA glycosylase AlkD